jgi:hypothetical protein
MPSTLQLELYIVGHAHNSQNAAANLRRLCEQQLAGRCELQIVDILEAHCEHLIAERFMSTGRSPIFSTSIVWVPIQLTLMVYRDV